MPLTIQNNNQREINLHQFFQAIHQLMKTALPTKDFLQIYDSKIRPLDFKDVISKQKLMDAEDDMMIDQELSPKYQVLKNLVLVELIWFDSQHILRETAALIHESTLPKLQQIISDLTETFPLILVSRSFEDAGSFLSPQKFNDILSEISRASVTAALDAHNKQSRHDFNEPAVLNEFIHMLDTTQIIQEILTNNHESPLLSQAMTNMYGFDNSNNLSDYLKTISQNEIIVPKKG